MSITVATELEATLPRRGRRPWMLCPRETTGASAAPAVSRRTLDWQPEASLGRDAGWVLIYATRPRRSGAAIPTRRWRRPNR